MKMLCIFGGTMKINDDSLVFYVWKYQLKTLAAGVLHRYVGGKHGLVSSDWYPLSANIGIGYERQLITDKLKPQQLRKRLVSLIKRGVLKWQLKDCTFFIDTPQANLAFQCARAFWSSKGIPEGYSDGRCRTIIIQNYDALLQECQDLLDDKFGQIEWGQLNDF